MTDENLFRGLGSEEVPDPNQTDWELQDERSHVCCYEHVSFGRRISDEGIEQGIRIGFHEHVGMIGILTPDGPTDMQTIAEMLYIHLTPNHAYDLLIGLLRALSDADEDHEIDWSEYEYPLPPDTIIMAMQALAESLYPGFIERPEHNDPHNS